MRRGGICSQHVSRDPWTNNTLACNVDPDNQQSGCQPHLPYVQVFKKPAPGRQSFTTMRNDTGHLFTEIYDSADALLSALEDIEKVALTKRSDDAPLHVRLLTPSGNAGRDFSITPIESFCGDEAYVAISYTWAYEQSIERLEIPDYHIWDATQPNRDPRPPQCPPIVLHQAVRYAQAKGYSYIWIDQECIHQDDDADRERHLQLMHRIYRASAVTIAVLSTYMPDLAVFEDFAL